MTSSSPLVMGIGEIIYDHYFIRNSQNTLYYDSRGGGSVWNVLLNLKSKGIGCIAAGAYGVLNPFGTLALDELRNAGVNTDYLQPVKNKTTRVVFEIVATPNNGNPIFTPKCPVCNNDQIKSKFVRCKNFNSLKNNDWSAVNTMVTDRLLPERVKLISSVKARFPNILTLVDIGSASYLTDKPASTILKQINSFDVAFINSNAFKIIVNILGTDDLFVRSNGKGDTSNLKYVIVTKGKAGVALYSRTSEVLLIRPAKKIPTVDSAGAGDILLSAFLASTIRNKQLLISPKNVVLFLKKAMLAVEREINFIGARGHLKKMNGNSSDELKSYKGQSVNKLLSVIKTKSTKCPFCWNFIHL